MEATKQIQKRMNRIGSKKNYVVESHLNDKKKNQDLVQVKKSSEGGTEVINLILEPDKYEELSMKTRLTFDEFCDCINTFIGSEEDDWDSLRMKDQINLSRDEIIAETMIKYAKEELKIDTDKATGREISYAKSYDEQGVYAGEIITVSLTNMNQFGVY
ncbi:hypothetical protein [Oceanobacillus profundus]|uniref:Uncharacterized protein n=1 Tax=Oceanobacillus profundus TaxID=372463 RepID=A0A417YGA0_9BACI|nr:hypothetical protein [Oceanobacillus profundus]MBR3119679.1 hypothetical protein [Oceanobacillus sp.]RHW31843.1 hypothetical protein D1B32_11425 [Oceanobacillus profundus]